MIISNKVKCLLCNDIIESIHRHDFKWCSCKNVAVDGGKSYLKRMYKKDEYEELSEQIADGDDWQCNECNYCWDDEDYNSTNCPNCGSEL